MPATPSFDASAVRCTSWAVFAPVEPAITGIDTAADTFSQSVNFSSSLSVGDSPVVPQTTRPSLPSASSQRASSTAPSTSSARSSSNGLIIAVSTRPKRGMAASLRRVGCGARRSDGADGDRSTLTVSVHRTTWRSERRRRSALRTIDGRKRDVGGASRKNTFSMAASTVSSVVLAAMTRSRYRCCNLVAAVTLAPVVVGMRRSSPVAIIQAASPSLATCRCMRRTNPSSERCERPCRSSSSIERDSGLGGDRHPLAVHRVERARAVADGEEALRPADEPVVVPSPVGGVGERDDRRERLGVTDRVVDRRAAQPRGEAEEVVVVEPAAGRRATP